MKNRTVLAVLLTAACAVLMISCGDTPSPTPSAETETAQETPKTPRVYVYEECFGGAVKGEYGYELSTEKSKSKESRTLNFAGQEFVLSPYEREVTRVFDGNYEIGDDGVEKTGKVLRCYEIYKGGDGARTVRAGYSSGGTPLFVEMSGKDVFYLEKSEKELTDMAKLWLSQIFRMSVEDMAYRMTSVMPKETLDGYIEGAATYQICYSEQIGDFSARSATVTASADRVVLLVRNYALSSYVDSLRAIGAESLKNTVKTALAKELPAAYRELSVDGFDKLGFDVCDGFPYIEFTASVSYVRSANRMTEQVYGIISLEDVLP